MEGDPLLRACLIRLAKEEASKIFPGLELRELVLKALDKPTDTNILEALRLSLICFKGRSCLLQLCIH